MKITQILITVLLILSTLQLTKALIVINPPSNQGQEKILVFFQDSQVLNSKYEAVLKQVQKNVVGKIKLWVVIPSFNRNIPNDGEAFGFITLALREVQQRGGFQGTLSDVFLGGHGLGGFIAKNLLDNNNRKFAGLILAGSYLSQSGNEMLLKLRDPVLTLGGELDGIARSTRIALEYSAFNELAQRITFREALINKPVVLLNGVNHGLFASALTVAGDLKPEVNEKDAHELISSVISSFMILQLNKNDSPSYSVLLNKFQSTTEIVKGFLGLREIEQTNWCKESHRITAGTDRFNNNVQIFQTTFPDVSDFGSSKPKETLNGGVLRLDCYSHNIYAWKLNEYSSLPTASANLGCKMRSEESVIKALRSNVKELKLACKDVNRQALELTKKYLTAKQLGRYPNGLNFEFLDDEKHFAGLTWIKSTVKVEEKNGKVTVKSPNLFTSLSSIILPGNNYCWLLSPARIAEWVMIDGLTKLK